MRNRSDLGVGRRAMEIQIKKERGKSKRRRGGHRHTCERGSPGTFHFVFVFFVQPIAEKPRRGR